MTPALPGQRPLLGVALIVLMSCCFATMDSSSRYLGRLMPVLVFFWGRYLFQAVVMGVWQAWRHGRAGFACAHPRFQAVRGTLLAATSAMSFYGVQHMPVPEFTAINMLTPLLVIVLAALWLHEQVTWPRWLLVAGGFAGAMIVIRPGSGLFGWAVLYPLAGTLLLTPALLASGIDVAGTLRAAPAGQIGLLLAIGALGTTGHLLLILALGMAPTAMLMPFVYVQIAAAAALGWLIFRQVPDGWAIAGMGVIAACGAAGAWLNLRGATQSSDPVLVDTTED